MNPSFPAGRFLAFDTSTERLSVAVGNGARVWEHEGPGAAQSSSTLIPVVLDLLGQAGLQMAQLDAIVFGRGPGSFTGLRTACAVAQGLAAGAGVPVLPVDTLLAVAEAARLDLQAKTPLQEGDELLALLDARMDEIYTQRFVWSAGLWRALGPCQLQRPEQLHALAAPAVVAGNASAVYASRLSAWPTATQQHAALPTAAALLSLAPQLMQAGLAVPADQALPLYVRDKVAQTTDERLHAKALAAHAALQAAPP